jgi:hypothetical protein
MDLPGTGSICTNSVTSAHGVYDRGEAYGMAGQQSLHHAGDGGITRP